MIVTSFQSDKAAGWRFSELNVQMGIYDVELQFYQPRLQHTYKRIPILFPSRNFKVNLVNKLWLSSQTTAIVFSSSEQVSRAGGHWEHRFWFSHWWIRKNAHYRNSHCLLYRWPQQNLRSNPHGTGPQSDSLRPYNIYIWWYSSLSWSQTPWSHLTSLWKASPTRALKRIWSMILNGCHYIAFHKCT